MDQEVSSFNVIHWEYDLNKLQKTKNFDVQVGATGGWLNENAVLQFRWRITCNDEGKSVLSFIAENNFLIPDLESFNAQRLKTLLSKSNEKVNTELKARINGAGDIFVSGGINDSMVETFYKDFKRALNVR